MVLITNDDIQFIASSLQSSERPDIKLFYLQHFSQREAISSGNAKKELEKKKCHEQASEIDIAAKHLLMDTSSLNGMPGLRSKWNPEDPFCLREDASLGNINWTLDRLLSIARVIRCDERFLWERIGPDFFGRFQIQVQDILLRDKGLPCLPEEKKMNCWLEQQAVKWTRDFLCRRHVCECSLHAKMSRNEQFDMENVCSQRGVPSSKGKEDKVRMTHECSTKDDKQVKDGEVQEKKSDLSLWNDLVRYITRVIKPISPVPVEPGSGVSLRSSGRELERSRSVSPVSTPPVPLSRCSSRGGIRDPVNVVPMNGREEGCLRCASTLPAFSELLRIPLSQLFCQTTVKQYCTLGHIIDGSPELRSSLGDDEETFLVICLIYERFVIGEADSHWGALLKSCPSSYPLVPSFWESWEWAELEGVDMIEEILRRKTLLHKFHDRVQRVLPFLSNVLSSVSELDMNSSSKVPPACFSEHHLRAIFSVEAVYWASATFDSRAFYLNLNGQTILVLSPIADMINHQCRSDVLVRCFRHARSASPSTCTISTPSSSRARTRVAPAAHIDSSVFPSSHVPSSTPRCGGKMYGDKSDLLLTTGDKNVEEEEPEFVLEIGAPLTREDRDRELWMSYGPLQNWELLQYYGFVLDENEYDTLPIPLQDFETVRVCGDVNHCPPEDAEEQVWQEERGMLATTYFLNTLNRFWIGVDGVPCPALLALLRLHLGSAEELMEMVRHSERVKSRGAGLPSRTPRVSSSSIPRNRCSPSPPPHTLGRTTPPPKRVDPFTPQNSFTEINVCKAIEDTVQCILQLYSTTLEEDEEHLAALQQEALNSHPHSAMGDHATTNMYKSSAGMEVRCREKGKENTNNLGKKEEEEGADENVLSGLRYQLALKLRIHLKRIAHRCLHWCAHQQEELRRQEA